MDSPQLHNEGLKRAFCALEGLSIGNAYGNHHGNNSRKRNAIAWEFSDDTNMALSIVSNVREFGHINQDELACSFAEHREGHRGYGQGVTRLLKRIESGGSWAELATTMFEGHGSYGNGAAMRVAPLGAYFADNIPLAVEQARLSSVVTHAHPEGVAGAIAVSVAAALAHQFRSRESTPDNKDFLRQVIAFVPETEVRQKIQKALELSDDASVKMATDSLGNGRPSIAQQTVPFALWMAAKYLTNNETAIIKTAGAMGDVDTNCAIVGGIVVMYTGVEGIPLEWKSRREAFPNWPFEKGDGN